MSPGWATFVDLVFKKNASFIVRSLWLSLIAVGGTWGILTIVEGSRGIRRLEISFASDAPGIVIERETADARELEKLFVLYPQDWLNTQIPIHEGDSVFISADGRVNIGLRRLIDAADYRRHRERQVKASREYIRRMAADPLSTRPEDFFTAHDIDSVAPQYAWSNPNGLEGLVRDGSVPGRTQKVIKEGVNYGALLGLVRPAHDDHSTPARVEFADVFFVGKRHAIKATTSGILWLVINDVWSDYVTGANPRIFFNDNLGSFAVSVLVKHYHRRSTS